MNSEDPDLVKLVSEHRQSLLDMLNEFATEQRFERLLNDAQTNFEDLIQQLADTEQGIDLPDGKVPQTTLWLFNRASSQFLGISHLRHKLNPVLEYHGGHIGYAIRPSQRGKGYGTQLLRYTLKEARQLGIERVLITCDADNIASVRVIENNGGQLENQLVSMFSGKLICRYWIDT